MDFFMKRLYYIIIFSLVTICAYPQSQAPLQRAGTAYGSLTQEDGLMDNSISYIFMDSRHLMYFGSFRGVDRFDGTKIVNIPFPGNNDKEDNYVRAIFEEDDGHLLLGNNIGLWRLDKKRPDIRRIYEKQIDCQVADIRRSGKTNDIIIKTQYGDWILKKGEKEKLEPIKGTSHAGRNYKLNPSQNLYSTRGKYDGWGRFKESFSSYTSPDGMKWVGYRFFGIDYTYYDRGIFKVFGNASRGMQVRSFLRDGKRTLLGTRDGLYVEDGDNVTHIDDRKLGAKIVTQIVRNGNDYYVATIGGGIKVVDARSLRVVQALMPKADVFQIQDDGKGRLWFCSTMGLGRYDLAGHKLKVFDTRNSQIPSDLVYTVGFGDGGNTWVSTSEGTCRYNEAGGYITVSNISNKVKALLPLRNIYKYSARQMLFIPQHGKPLIYDIGSDMLRTINLETDKGENAFLFVHHAGKGKWLYATSNGLFYSDGTRMRKFGYIDGLDNMQFQSNSISIDDKGVLWAATNSGLIYAKVRDIVNHHYSHHDIILNGIQTDHWFNDTETNNVLMTKTLRLSRYRNDVAVSFSPVVYGNTRGITYRYKLSNSNDTAWHAAPHDRTITFHNLPAGVCTLHIEAVGMPEISTDVKLDIPYTYQAITIFVAIVLILLFAGYVVYCKKTKTEFFWEKLVPKPEKYQKSHIDATEAKKLQKAVIKYLDEKKPYLNPDFQMSDLAKAIGCSTHELSQVFSQYLKRNYYDLIAEYRVKEFKILAADPKCSKYTITAISEKCGFKSRTPFLTAFKKFTGKTPKEYMKDVK